MEIKYSLWDPTGNQTVLVETPVEPSLQPRVAAAIMKIEPTAEQVGFVQGNRLRMAGGEFCGNASICAAAQYCMRYEPAENKHRVGLTVSGIGMPVTVDLKNTAQNAFSAEIDMPPVKEIKDVTLYDGDRPVSFCAAVLDGITHLITEETPDRARAEKNIRTWCRELGCEALGILFIKPEAHTLTPLVYVPSADTLYWESSCASGTTAVAGYFYKKDPAVTCLSWRQPGGILGTVVTEKGIRLRGTAVLIRGNQLYSYPESE